MRRTESWRAEFEARATLRQAIEDARPERIATAELLPGAWDNLSAQDPQTILWTKPAQVLRDMLGVSDVTIVNRARKYGIPVPGRGFWNKVAAGKIPHPRGVPQKIRPLAGTTLDRKTGKRKAA